MATTAEGISLDLSELAAGLATFQSPSGLFLQTRGGVGDPWNHVEVLMALTVTGEYELAQRGYRWLQKNQLGDGSWFHYYRADCIHSARIDFNVIGYVATGLLQYFQCTNDFEFVRELWPTVERATKLITSQIGEDGGIAWSLDSRGRFEAFSLLTGSSSLAHSLQSANTLALLLGCPPPVSTKLLGALQHRVAKHPELFADKQQFAMDWYYPVVAGVKSFSPSSRNDFEKLFLIDGLGVRCVSTSDWVTTAETSEYALTLLRSGDQEAARKVLVDIGQLRSPDGLFYTGMGHPSRVTFPHDEVSSYSTAAFLLAWDALEKITPAHGLFTAEVELAPHSDCAYC